MNRWPPDKANQWYAAQPWLVGCNFTPSSAINQLEMWQADTFDPAIIDRELAFAQGLGFNTLRVYLHDLCWDADAESFKARIERFLQLTEARAIRPIFVIFDDCWNPDPKPGKQPAPQPGIHNSGWVQSPGLAAVNEPQTWPRLQRYVQGLVGSFGNDKRILMWDLYNEPGAGNQAERSLPLLCKTFEWARAAEPSQPLTAGLWSANEVLNTFQLFASDVISFHNYSDAQNLSAQIADLARHGRPLICTEWLRRGHSDVAACLPVFHEKRVACCNWGLVSGKTNTIFPWGSPPAAPEPALWFHDLLRPDGSPFSEDEVRLFRQLTAR